MGRDNDHELNEWSGLEWNTNLIVASLVLTDGDFWLFTEGLDGHVDLDGGGEADTARWGISDSGAITVDQGRGEVAEEDPEED